MLPSMIRMMMSKNNAHFGGHYTINGFISVQRVRCRNLAH